MAKFDSKTIKVGKWFTCSCGKQELMLLVEGARVACWGCGTILLKATRTTPFPAGTSLMKGRAI